MPQKYHLRRLRDLELELYPIHTTHAPYALYSYFRIWYLRIPGVWPLAPLPGYRVPVSAFLFFGGGGGCLKAYGDPENGVMNSAITPKRKPPEGRRVPQTRCRLCHHHTSVGDWKSTVPGSGGRLLRPKYGQAHSTLRGRRVGVLGSCESNPFSFPPLQLTGHSHFRVWVPHVVILWLSQQRPSESTQEPIIRRLRSNKYPPLPMIPSPDP